MYALRQVGAGTAVKEICRKLGLSAQTLYKWRRKFAGLGLAEPREPRQLLEESERLKRLARGLILGKRMLRDVHRTKV